MIELIKNYIRKEILPTLKGDIIGGITVAFVALPLALSFGVLSGVGAAAGIYGAICTGIITSMFGGTKAQISGPTGAMTVVLVDMFGKYGLDGLIAAMIVAGVFQIIMGVFKLGKYIRLIPQPVIIGFTNGIGILIFCNQFEYFEANPVLCILTLALMFIIPKVNKKLPYALLALIIGTVVSKMFIPANAIVGPIPIVMPSLSMPNLANLNILDVVQAGFILALLGAIESLLASLVVDEMTQTKHNSDREIVGQGIANTIAACFGFLIGTGAIVRSVVNVNAGGRGRMSGIIHALVLLAMVVLFGDLAAGIPLAVLGGILMGTSLKMIEYEESYRLGKASKEAAAVIAITTILTVVVDLTFAVAVGTLASALIMLFNTGSSYLKEYPVEGDSLKHKIKSFTIEGAMFFLVSDNLINTIEVRSDGADIVVVNLSHAQVVDITGVVVLGKLQTTLQRAGIRTIFTGMKESTYEKMVKLGILDGSEKEVNIGDKLVAVEYAKHIAGLKKDYLMQVKPTDLPLTLS